MKKRKKNVDYRKTVIKLLMEKCMTTNDLRKESEIPRRTLYRILDELQPDLITKKDGCWIWCRYKKPWRKNEVIYGIVINHAKELLPGFLALLEDQPQTRYHITGDKYISPEQSEKLKEFAESHLKTAPSYQSIYNNLIEFRRLKSKLNELYTEEIEKMLRDLKGKILTPDRFLNWKPKEKPSKSWFRKLFPEVFFVKRDIPYALGPFDTKEEISVVLGVYKIVLTGLLFQADKTKKWYVLGPIGAGVDSHKILKKLDDFIQTKELMINVSGDLTGELDMLKLQVEHGQPLDDNSYCGICPNIIIKEEDSKKA